MQSFVSSKFLSVGNEGRCGEMKNGQKLKLGYAHVTLIYSISTSVKALGCPRHSLLHQQKHQVIFPDTMFLLLHALCIILGALFVFYFSLFGFVCCSILLDSIIHDLEKDTLRFHCREHSSFHFIHHASVHSLLVPCLAFVFHL